MPELPEVETIRRQLAPLVEGRRLLRVEILDPRWSRPLTPDELADALRGRRIERLDRRGKYLVWHLAGEVFLAQHLRMTGAVLCEPSPEPAHVRVRLELGAPSRTSALGASTNTPEPGARPRTLSTRPRGPRRRRLVIVDPRRFGTGELLLGEEAMERFFAERLGLEPLDERFTAEHLRALARGRGAPVKAFLLDQRRVAGVGNIYADEALFRAGIHPLRPAGRLSLAQCARLREGVVEALGEGIDARGATIDDFRHVDGVRGSFQDRFLVHRREGLPCPRCGRTIVKLVVAGRGTYVCERCQPRPRGAGRRLRPLAETGMLAEGQCLPASVETGMLAAGLRLPASVDLRSTARSAGRSRRPPGSR
ncbi:MAG TPA: bifunctional DNA-formamidopyrimidine glycosylase/DNA-(apurinic or apyrimidinic site) lyase [Solirubrobacteraceae bacterium]|nr:bifunctional DNA-formamidopyrimidine glycosylase/DNA-(apurinic or apyrimidinic site) lyase [Solirubrobacteraceae bacterium]